MPSRGAYQITSRDQGKQLQRDQSYRSCILALLIFFFLCVLLIVACLPWKTTRLSYQHGYRENPEASSPHRAGQTERTTRTTERVETLPEVQEEPEEGRPFEPYEVPEVEVGSSTIFDEATESSYELLTSSTDNYEFTNDELAYEYSSTGDYVINPSADNAGFSSTSTEADWFFNKSETLAENLIVSTDNYKNYEHSSTETEGGRVNLNECTTGECKQTASRILFYMNHSADPCEDFYEYVCGGFEEDPRTVEQDLESISYQRINREMRKDGGRSPLFKKYYNSCLRYERVDVNERIRAARRVLGRVGKFYTNADWTTNHTSFTELLAKLLLDHSAILFDVVPDLDEYHPELFTLKIGPTAYRSPFDTDEQTDDSCYATEFERDQETVDLGRLYKEYKTCKNDTKKFIKSISEALTALGVFSELKNEYNISQYIQTTVINVDLEIVQKFFANYPAKNKIREAYLMKNYTYVTVRELDSTCKIVNWTQLIYTLTKQLVIPEARLQVYFYDELIKGLNSLEEFRTRDARQLNNALLGLYAHNLYREFVLSKHRDANEHCLRVAASLLIPEASSLYISSFSNDELVHMKETIRETFDDLKETLILNIEKAEWAAEEGRSALIGKMNKLEVTVPDISYLSDRESTYKIYNADTVRKMGKLFLNSTVCRKENLSDNYLEESIALMQRYRTLMYAGLLKNPGHPEQIWTHYATPFQSKGLAIYGLNLVVIPFGVVDWSTIDKESFFDHFRLATLGNVIAHQIAHHFDANGIYYWNGTRDAKYSLLNENDTANSNFKDYINCQRNDLYQKPMDIALPSTGQTVSYQISQLTLNERLSETMGLRLAYDTLVRLRSRKEIHLPWLELEFDQLFYVAYAQMHCTKAPITLAYVSLYEDEQLPSRIRILVSASSDRLLGEAWNCPEGSRVIPSYTCSVFPYLQSKDNAIYLD